MKKLLSDKKKIFIVIILIYILSQILGTFAIKKFFLDYKIKEILPRLKYIAREIGSGNLNIPKNNDFILKAYDIHGVELDVFNEKKYEGLGIHDDIIYKSLVNYLPKVFEGNKVALLKRLGNQPAESIVIGTPIIKNNVVIGAVFLLKPASDFNATLNGFYLIFFVVLIIGMLIIGIFLNLYFKEVLQLEQTRIDYIANVSHELKSPIASIKALTETLTDNIIQDDETKAKYYGIILEESNSLNKRITDMLELSRIQNGKMDFEKKNICSKALMQELYEKYFTIIADMDIVFEVTKTAFDLPDIHTSKDRILQIFNIIIDNATKFICDDGMIVIDAEIHSGYIKFLVSDNGVGIEKAKLPYIFDRFYKDDGLHNKNGSGLGLSIAKEIIEGLGEQIWVVSERGKRTTFSFTVRRA